MISHRIAIADAEQAMGIKADHTLVLDDDTDRGDASQHRHVAIAWEGGVLWLDMSDLGDHYCIDVRQFRGRKLAATGMFSIIAGRRVAMDDSDVPEGERVKANGWAGAWMPILLMDKNEPALRDED